MPRDENMEPMLFKHCKNTYDTMFQKAERVGDQLVYEGTLTNLVTRDLNLSIPYYTLITRALKGMGCIRQLRRGGGTSSSQWELLKEPKQEDFDVYSADDIQKRGKATPTDQLRYELGIITKRVNDLEEGFIQLAKLVKNHQEGTEEKEAV